MSFELFQPETWKLWRGIEVEGRWRGIPTLFVGAMAAPEDILALSKTGEHIYFNPQFFAYQKSMRCNPWEVVLVLLDSGHPVTVSGEVDILSGLPERIASHPMFHFMLVIVAPLGLDRLLWRTLSENSTLRLQFDGAFNASVTVHHFVTCDESCYSEDERVL